MLHCIFHGFVIILSARILEKILFGVSNFIINFKKFKNK